MERKKIRSIALLALLLLVMVVSTGCGMNSSTKKNKETSGKSHIKIGTMASFEDFIYYLPEKMSKLGYQVEFVLFDDVTTPNIALVEGSIDANFYQHRPYLIAYNEAKKTDLHACEPYLIASMDSIISLKYKTLEELPVGAQIGISDDPSNLSANLHSLAFAGLIKLAEVPEGSYYTMFDIIENPKNFEFVELPLAFKSAALPDLDAIVNFYGPTTARTANILRLLDDDPSVPFPVVFAINGKDKDEVWVRDMMDAVTGDEFRSVVAEKNSEVYTWRILFD